ncbi:hypothetical protein BFP72_12860 [Reichenbachiella sp. 5M10]|uniref:SGNH/GDSL hydrolase family protein n=1 Tax=Reichenbachiella sp. 5M10 TaxID=1889772 RepID=UPI000C14C8DA|nr:SGNH/GDSL hydrolase family protein [Reichenbachiella sp. 5M10]PIB36217.1 hypothetical protein BFP72_12860 [Reichenbachiella sp. 5M10]
MNRKERAHPKKKAPLVFYVIAGMIPILFFVCLEVGLRVADYGRDYRLFHEPRGGVPGMLYLNPARSYKYFGQLEGAVFFHGIGFAKEKSPSTYRVFVLGGSSAQGFPYAQNASFPSHLRRRLQHSYPERDIEVVNLAASAINSYTLLDILPEVLEQAPDALLIYAGHNEYYGALGPASSRSFGTHRYFVKTLLALKEYRLFQALEHTVARLSPSRGDAANLMEDMIGESAIATGTDIYQAGIDQFEGNLKDILSTIESSGVPVLVGTLSSNLRGHAPFKSKERNTQGLTAKQCHDKANRLVARGQVTAAKEYYVAAKELDGLRFRAPERINEIIRAVTADYQVPLVDIDSLFNAVSPYQIVGDNLMCDHLHPNMEGYYLMGRAYHERMLALGMLPVSEEPQTDQTDEELLAAMPFTKLDSLQAKLTLVNLLGNYPYVPKGAPNPLLETITIEDYVDKIGAVRNVDSARVLVAGHHWESGDTAAFVREIRVLASYFPSKEQPYLRALSYLEHQGYLQEAYPYLLGVLETQPVNASRLKMQAKGHVYGADFARAAVILRQAIEKRNQDIDLHRDLGYAYLMLGQHAEAETEYSRVIALDPGDLEARHQRGVARFELKDYEGTIEDFNEVIAKQEGQVSLPYFIRGYAFYGAGDEAAACLDWKQAAQYGHQDAHKLGMQFCN